MKGNKSACPGSKAVIVMGRKRSTCSESKRLDLLEVSSKVESDVSIVSLSVELDVPVSPISAEPDVSTIPLPADPTRTLADRIKTGTVTRPPSSGIFNFKAKIMKNIPVGHSVDDLKVFDDFVRHHMDGRPNILNSPVSLEDLLEVFQSSEADGCWPLGVIHEMITQLEPTFQAGSTFLLCRALRSGFITDRLYPNIISSIISRKDPKLVLELISSVSDLCEHSVAKIIDSLFSMDGYPPSKYPGYSDFEAVCLGVMTWNFSADAMKSSISSFSAQNLMSLLGILKKALHDYSSTHGDTMSFGEGIVFPSRTNILKWLEVVLDALYSKSCEISPTTDLSNIKRIVDEQCHITDILLHTRANTSAMSYISGRYGKNGRKHLSRPFTYADYVIENDSF